MSHRVNSINCAEAVARLYDFLDREGPEASIEEVEAHLDICRHCCSRFAFEAQLWQTVRVKGTESRCPESLKSKVRSMLDQY